MADEVETRIDEIYAGALDGFIARRDALAKALKTAGAAEEAKRVKALRKPVVPAYAVNRLAREDPDGVADLAALGDRLRAAQRRAISGGDVDALREALDERRRRVRDLTKAAMAILRADGSGTAAHEEEITATLEAAAADEEAGAAVVAGRLEKPLRPPSGFGEGGLRVLEGGRGRPPAKRSADPSPPRDTASTAKDERDRAAAERARERERRDERRRLEREFAQTEKAERAAQTSVDRARERLERAEAERVEAKDELRAAETALRGATLERKRAAAALDRAD